MNSPQKTLSIILISLISFSLIVSIASIFISSPVPKKEKHVTSQPEALKFQGKGCVAIVPIYGVIEMDSDRGFFGMANGSDAVCEMLNSLLEKPNIKAIILRINSPGGTIGATQEIYDKLEKMRAKGVKIVASLGDIAASGGYYLACAADKIYANPGTLTGSIGVIISSFEMSGALDKIGIKMNVIKSGEHKDILSPYRKMTEQEQNILQACIDDSYSQFLTVVSERRKIPYANLREIADGRIFTGRQAKNMGLIDETGSLDAAISAAGEMAGLGDKPPIYSEQEYLLDTIKRQFKIMFDRKNLLRNMLNSGFPKLEYRYFP